MNRLNRILLIGLTTHLCCAIANAQMRPIDIQEPEFEGWDFSAAKALAVHGHYGPEDFYKLDRDTRYASTHLCEFVPTATVCRQGSVFPGISPEQNTFFWMYNY